MTLNLRRVVADYDGWPRNDGRRVGFNNINSVPDNGLGDGVLDWLSAGGKALLGPLSEKADKLDMAIKAILVLSGIAALTGVVTVLRR